MWSHSLLVSSIASPPAMQPLVSYNVTDHLLQADAGLCLTWEHLAPTHLHQTPRAAAAEASGGCTVSKVIALTFRETN